MPFVLLWTGFISALLRIMNCVNEFSRCPYSFWIRKNGYKFWSLCHLFPQTSLAEPKPRARTDRNKNEETGVHPIPSTSCYTQSNARSSLDEKAGCHALGHSFQMESLQLQNPKLWKRVIYNWPSDTSYACQAFHCAILLLCTSFNKTWASGDIKL